MGADRFRGFAREQGVELTSEIAAAVITRFRKSYPEIPLLWRNVESMARAAIKCPDQRFTLPPELPKVAMVGERLPDGSCTLWAELPSGRRLCYAGARIDDSERWPDGGVKLRIEYFGG